MHLEHYIGREIEIIYEDKHGEITQRHIVMECCMQPAWRLRRGGRLESNVSYPGDL